MTGRFIAFEGLDGSGKTTVAHRVSDRLRAGGHDVVLTREPGGTPIGAEIRRLILDHPAPATPETELLLICADRAEHVRTVIRPALEQGQIVLTDRYAGSTRAYQGSGLQMDSNVVDAALQIATDGLEPDLTILFDIDPSTADQRRSSDRSNVNQLDLRDLAFRARVRDGFLAIAAASEKWVVIDASLGIDDVTANVADHVTAFLSRVGAVQ